MDDAVKQELARIQQVYVEKRADVLTQIQQYLDANPEARTALLGAAAGGAAGVAHSYMKPKAQRTTLSDALTGAGLGAAAGGLGHLAHSAYGAAREAPRPVAVGGQTYQIPREMLRDQGFVQDLANLREPSLVNRAADALGKGLGATVGSPSILGGLAAGEGLHRALSSRSLPFLGKGLGDTFLNLGATSRAPRGVSEIWEGLKNLKPDSEALFGPTRESTLATWRQFVEGNPDDARQMYGMRGQGYLRPHEVADALKREVRRPNFFVNDIKPGAPNASPVTPTTLDALADVGGRIAGATLDDKGNMKLPPTAPPKFNFFGRRMYAPRLGGMGMRLGLLGGGLGAGLLAEDYFDTAARERSLQDLLARKIVVGDA